VAAGTQKPTDRERTERVGHSAFAPAGRSDGMDTRGELDVEDLLKIVLVLVVVLLVVEIVGEFVSILASMGPVVAVVIVALILAYFLDYI
jgi:hypothetical protein